MKNNDPFPTNLKGCSNMSLSSYCFQNDTFSCKCKGDEALLYTKESCIKNERCEELGSI